MMIFCIVCLVVQYYVTIKMIYSKSDPKGTNINYNISCKPLKRIHKSLFNI